MCCWLVEDIAGWLFSALLCWWECWRPVWRIMRGLIKRNLSGWGFMCWQNPDFAPLLTVAAYINPSSIGAAAITTLLLVGGLTFTAFSIKDFSFLRSFLTMAGFIAFGAIIASVICGFSLGVWFSALMVLLCAGFILYDTSNIIHHYLPIALLCGITSVCFYRDHVLVYFADFYVA